MPEVRFGDFENALWFLKQIKIGKVQRDLSKEGYIWEVEDKELSPEQLSFYEAYIGTRSTWADSDTGLTWLLSGCYSTSYVSSINKQYYAGQNDWRIPTLRELKTLRAVTADKHGMFVKRELEGLISGTYVSSTEYNKAAHLWEPAWWCFKRNCADKEEVSEGKIIWGSEGGFAGLEKDRAFNFANVILVRGNANIVLSERASALVNWAESDQFHDFPAAQEGIDNLYSIDIPYWVKNVPKEFILIKSLRNISFQSGVGLENIIFRMKNLENIHIRQSYSDATMEIPDIIGELRNLVSLKAERAGIKNVPESIGQLKRLIELDLKFNKIKHIPDSIGGMYSLKKLDLSFNNISKLPSSIGDLLNLEQLSLNRNSLEELPDSIVNLQNLQKFSFNGAKIRCLPVGFGQLKNLQTLHCADTCLNELPEEFISLTHLVELNISNCNFEQFPAILSKMSWINQIKR
jgi:Leucine-rich repeat (LRR) protein